MSDAVRMTRWVHPRTEVVRCTPSKPGPIGAPACVGRMQLLQTVDTAASLAHQKAKYGGMATVQTGWQELVEVRFCVGALEVPGLGAWLHRPRHTPHGWLLVTWCR